MIHTELGFFFVVVVVFYVSLILFAILQKPTEALG